MAKFRYKRDAAKYFNMCVDTFNRILKEYDIDYRKYSSKIVKHKLNSYIEIDKQWLIDNWINTGKSLRQLSEEFNVPEGTLESRALMFNLKKSYKTPLNYSRFFNIYDLHIWYLAGLIATDGYVPSGGYNAIELSLTGDSEAQLIQEIADYYNAVSVHHYGRNHVLRISYPGINKFFEEVFNIPPGPKTFTLQVPKSFPNEQCAKAYFLGCMDGDGCLSSSEFAFSLTTASEDFVVGLNQILKTYLGISCCVYFEKREGKKLYPTISSSCSKAKLVEQWMYSIIDDCFFLRRKYLRYKQVNDIV